MAATWQHRRDGYHLDHAGLRGTVALRGAAPGLRKLSLAWGDKTLRWPGPMLAVRSIQVAGKSPYPVGFPGSRTNHRLRANSLDIQLDETSRCPARLQIYWSAARVRELAMIEMEVLVTTVREFDKLEVITWSELPAPQTTLPCECLIPLSSNPGRWIDVREASLWHDAPSRGPASRSVAPHANWLVVPRDRDAAHLGLDGRTPRLDESIVVPPFRSPIVCYRPAGQSWSYVELTHPADCVRIIARRERGKIAWGFGLFGLDIEKGVILRGRVRSTYIPRRRDTQQATRLFKQFIAEPPHLSV